MKKVIITTPTFTPAAKTVDLSIPNFDIRNLYAIVNQTTGILIFATGTLGRGFTNVVGSVVTLEYDTTGMNSADRLQIIYDDPEDTQISQALYEVAERLSFLAGVKGPAANLRTTVTDGTVSTVSNIGAIGNIPSQPIIPSTINIGAIQSNISNIVINIA